MNPTLVTGLFALFTFVAPGAPASQGGDGAPHHGRKGHGNICEKLECTAAQKEKISEIRAGVKADLADERAQMKELREAFHSEKKAATPNEEKLAELAAQMKDLHAAMKKVREAKRSEIDAVLTDAQREQLAKMRAEHEAKRGAKGERKGKHRGKGKGKGAKSKGAKSKDAKSKDATSARADRRERAAAGLAKASAKRERTADHGTRVAKGKAAMAKRSDASARNRG